MGEFLLAFGGYSLVALLLIRPLAGHFAWTMKRNHYERLQRPSGDQWFGAIALALFVGMFWPIAFIWYMQDKKGRKFGAERQAELEAARKRIKQLEKEVDV